MQRQKSLTEMEELDFRPKILKSSEEIVKRREAKITD
jgi:hypothetical protein